MLGRHVEKTLRELLEVILRGTFRSNNTPSGPVGATLVKMRFQLPSSSMNLSDTVPAAEDIGCCKCLVDRCSLANLLMDVRPV